MRELAPLARRAWDERLLPDRMLDWEDFEGDLAEAERRPRDVQRFHDANRGYVDDILVELDWVRACERCAAWSDPDGGDPDDAFEFIAEPVRNEWRHGRRNDPCPCGSGRKAKKCCLAG